MGYYRGDYYAGVRGDPGFFSFLGGVAKSAVGLIPGVGPVLSSVLQKIPGRAAPAAAGVASTGGMAIIRKGAGAVGGAILKHPVLSAAGAAGAVGALGMAGAEHLMAGGGACPRGFHISKSKHAKHFGACVRNRRMNPCNPRALRRSIRRAHAFTKLAMKTIHLVHPKKKGRFGGFKKRKRT
jgi:hypothetical protein